MVAVAAGVEAHQALEDAVPLVVGDARAGVGDGDSAAGPSLSSMVIDPPAGVYLRALSSRLDRICDTLVGSATTIIGAGPLRVTVSCGASMAARSASASAAAR